MSSKTSNKNPINKFEIQRSNDKVAVYRRVISPKGKSQKQVNEIVSSLPTVTIHYFSKEDYDRLKTIEAELRKKYKFPKPKISYVTQIKRGIRAFLEV